MEVTKRQWWEEMQFETIRGWNEDLELVETWRWTKLPLVVSSPFYRSSSIESAVSGEINEGR